ncbi:MAG TPA: papain-like cysteine protease family protein [Rhizomicrobium sp.]|nr:papain-like cysteine protease family protein [Rhizomicrobium sp.]
MDRRTFLGSAAGLGLAAAAPGRALAVGKCVSVAYGGMCTSALSFDKALRNFAYDQQDRWCWSAAVSMIFAFYGYKVGQSTIVERAYDGKFDLTGDFVEDARQLNRPWVDENGKTFNCLIKPLFAVAPYAENQANRQMIDALDQGQPVLLCDAHHAMVLTAITYVDDPSAPIVKRAIVADPWPDADPHVYALAPEDLTAPPAGRLHLAAVVQCYAANNGDLKDRYAPPKPFQ